MRTKEIRFVEAFTDCPGGRDRANGDFSGEEFLETILEPALDSHDFVSLDLNGALSFPASFVDGAFGALVRRRGLEGVMRQLELRLDDNPVGLAMIFQIMSENAEHAQGGVPKKSTD